jgi:hypothetical protein
VLVELLLGARVFAFLEQVFGLVALAPRVGERERAILAVPYALIRHLEMRLISNSRIEKPSACPYT